MNTFYAIPVGSDKDQEVHFFENEERETLNTLQGDWVFWKKPHESLKFDVYYAWKSTWDQGCRIISRDFAEFFNSIVAHEEKDGFHTKSAVEPAEELIPVNRELYNEPVPISESQTSKDPEFEVTGVPDELDDKALIDYMHPAWTTTKAEADPQDEFVPGPHWLNQEPFYTNAEADEEDDYSQEEEEDSPGGRITNFLNRLKGIGEGKTVRKQ